MSLVLAASWVCYALGALLAGLYLPFRPRWLGWRMALTVSLVFGALGSVLGGVVALFAPAEAIWRLPVQSTVLPIALKVRLDALGKPFLALVSLMGLLSAIHAIEHARKGGLLRLYNEDYEFFSDQRTQIKAKKGEPPPPDPMGRAGEEDLSLLGLAHNALLLALSLAVTADDGVLFLIAWELGTLAPGLTMYLKGPGSRAGAGETTETRQAVKVYLTSRHLGTFAIAMGLLLLGLRSGRPLSLSDPVPPGPAATAALCLLAIAFAVQAAVVPFHTWLPLVQNSTPMSLQPLVSAAGTKLAVYGVLRFCFLPSVVAPYSLGLSLVVVGASSAFLGFKYAMAAQDLKRILAYHTTESMGFVFVGLGVGVIGRSVKVDDVAVWGVTAAILHTVAHTLYKALLLFSSARFEAETGTTELTALRGTARRLPLAAFAFAIGMFALVGIPPLNGFVSEWFTFQALIRCMKAMGERPRDLWVGLLVLFSVALSAAAVGTAVSAARAFICLFGKSDRSQAPPERWSMAGGMLILLVVACVGSGIFGANLAGATSELSSRLLGTTAAINPGWEPASMPIFACWLGLCVLLVGAIGWQTSKAKPSEAERNDAPAPSSQQIMALSFELSTLPRWEAPQLEQAPQRQGVLIRAPSRLLRDHVFSLVLALATWLRERAQSVANATQSGDSGLYIAYLLGILVLTMIVERIW